MLQFEHSVSVNGLSTSSAITLFILLIVGRITASESLFYYDDANGFDYDYYNSSRSYTPVFDIQPTPQQEQEAQQVCTVDGDLNRDCAFDYYATGNAVASSTTASVSSHYVAAQNSLGLFAVVFFC